MAMKPDKPNTGRKTRRRRKHGEVTLVAEQAAVFGVKLPIEEAEANRFLSPNDIGKILNVTGEAVKQWIYHRRLPAVKLANGYWKVRVTDFEAFLKARYEVARRRVLVAGIAGGEWGEVAEAIERLGHHALLAHNYADAMLKALDHQPALFVIYLPPKDEAPWKFMGKIRVSKSLHAVPILLVSDTDLAEADAERAAELYVQGFLKKPVEKSLLENEIKRILERV